MRRDEILKAWRERLITGNEALEMTGFGSVEELIGGSRAASRPQPQRIVATAFRSRFRVAHARFRHPLRRGRTYLRQPVEPPPRMSRAAATVYLRTPAGTDGRRGRA